MDKAYSLMIAMSKCCFNFDIWLNDTYALGQGLFCYFS